MNKETDDLKEKFIETVKRTVKSDIAWVLFSHGTFIIIKEKIEDLTKEATEFLKEFGPIVPGTEMGDFSIMDLATNTGWIITSWKKPMMTIVLKDEFDNEDYDDISIGMYGRHKRGLDADELEIIYINE